MVVETITMDADQERLAKLYGGGGGDADERSLAAKNAVKELGRHLNCLEDNNRATRKRSIEGIKKDTLQLEPEVLELVFCEIQKPILHLLSDSVEKCRELSSSYVGEVLRSSTRPEVHLPYVIPALLRRLGAKDVVETCEELRLQLVDILVDIVERVGNRIAPYIDDLVKILCQTLVDPFPEAKKRSCVLASLVAKAAPAYFQSASERLIEPLTKGLSHQHSRVRVAFAKAIGDVVQYGSNKSVDDVIFHLSQRMFDQSAPVRQALVDVIGTWILDLPDRYSFWHRFIPLLLAAFADEMPEIADSAKAFWHDAGLKFEQENEEDLKDKLNFPKPPPEHYPKGYIRPTLGCRQLIYGSLIRILPAAINDTKDWVADTRKMAARLIFYLILQSEDNIHHHLPTLLDGLYREARDDESEVVLFSLKTSELIGYFSPPEVWMPLVLSALRKTSGASNVVQVLASAIKGTKKEALRGAANGILESLLEPEVAWSQDESTQLGLLSCVSSFIKVLGDAVAEGAVGDAVSVGEGLQLAPRLFYLTVTAEALSRSSRVKQEANNTLSLLAEAEHLGSNPSILLPRHARFVLDTLKCGHEYWNALSPQRHVFETLLLRVIASKSSSTASHEGDSVDEDVDVIADLIDDVVPIIVVNMNPEKDLELRQHLFGLLIQLFTNAGSIESRRELISDYAEIILTDAVMPNLVWIAGRTAAVVRTTAIACLWQMILTKTLTPMSILAHEEALVKQVVAALEDDAPDTRNIACKVIKAIIEQCGDQIDLNKLQKLYPDFLKRLDDVDDGVRLTALQIFAAFFTNVKSRKNFEEEISSYRAHYEDIYKGLLIHMDDPLPSFQYAVCSVLMDCGCLYRKELIKSVETATHKHRTPKYCQQILDKLQQTSS